MVCIHIQDEVQGRDHCCAGLASHGNELAAVVGGVVVHMLQHLPYGSVPGVALGIVIVEHIVQGGVFHCRYVVGQLGRYLLPIVAGLFKSTIESGGHPYGLGDMLKALQPYIFGSPGMVHRLSQRGKAALYLFIHCSGGHLQQGVYHLFVGPLVVAGILVEQFFHHNRKLYLYY